MEKSELDPLEFQRKQKTAGIVYLGLNQANTEFVNNLFSMVQHNNTGRVLRSELQKEVKVPRTRLNVCRGNIRYRGPMLYKQLDGEIYTAKSYKTFTKRPKQNGAFM